MALKWFRPVTLVLVGSGADTARYRALLAKALRIDTITNHESCKFFLAEYFYILNL